MRVVRVGVSGMMALVLFVAVSLVAFRSGSEEWFRSLYTTTISAMLFCTIAAKLSRKPYSAFWFGFASCGWSYLIVGLGLGPRVGAEVSEWDNDQLLNAFLLTTPLIKSVVIAISSYVGIQDVGRYGYSAAIGHLIVTWSLAAFGGSAAFLVSKRHFVEASADGLSDKGWSREGNPE